jgi:hypothetical protein
MDFPQSTAFIKINMSALCVALRANINYVVKNVKRNGNKSRLHAPDAVSFFLGTNMNFCITTRIMASLYFVVDIA